MQPDISRTARSSHTEMGMAEQEKRENLAQHGGGQAPGNTFCHPLFLIAPLNTPDGEASSMSNPLLASENFLISGFGMDASAPSEQQTSKFIHFRHHELHTLEGTAPVSTQVRRSAGSPGWGRSSLLIRGSSTSCVNTWYRNMRRNDISRLSLGWKAWQRGPCWHLGTVKRLFRIVFYLEYNHIIRYMCISKLVSFLFFFISYVLSS